MPHPCRHRIPLVVLFAGLAASLAGPAPAAGPPAEPRLLEDGRGGVAVAHAGGLEPLVLPSRASARSVAALAAGWLVAGTIEEAGRSELWLARSGPGGWQEVAAPADRTGALRQGPELVASARGLSGMAWLEGDAHDRLAVRFAPWDGERFGPAATVAPPGPGSQLALAGATLADGRRLLVWAGYDGNDDEIWSAVGSGAGWSAPARVAADDEAPDITPSVIAESGGALVAWSRFDGAEYRVAVARFDGERFEAPRWAAPPGSLYPTLERDGGALALLFRDAVTDAWVLSELDGEGRPGRSTRLEPGPEERPAVAFDRGGARWRTGGRELRTAWR